jgi:hypothetical protein
MKISSKGRVRASDKDGSEEYVRGRKAGVDSTYGEDHDGVAERTVASGKRDSDGGGEGALGSAARGVYQHSLKNGGGVYDGKGDRALHDR